MKRQINQYLTGSRTEYISGSGDFNDFPENPSDLFEKWLTEAINAGENLPNAMHLSTVGKDGKPSGRIVLLHGLDERGFIFYTNYESRKGKDLENCKYAALTFFWPELFRQIRIEGDVFRLPDSESEEYFISRPRESQLSALASEQSKILDSRENLENKIHVLDERFKDQPVPRPSFWGGYYLSPVRIEFWQGRPRRLHDRILYKLESGKWIIQMLNP